ncbi:MAG: hypothetical protein ACOC1K_08435 [Nanoarchaeota archaeon]
MIIISDIDFESKEAVERAFNFLNEHFINPKPFTKEEFKSFCDYPNPDNFDTHYSKKFRHLIEDAPNEEDKYLVSEIFQKFSTFDKFFSFYSQSQKLKSEYSEYFYDKLLLFEFYLPLTSERDLRRTLDNMFYRDKIELMINKIKKEVLERAFPYENDENEEEYLDRLINWISGRFGGYSIETVAGRFKADDLKTFKEVGNMLAKGKTYLIDETTAIVRFIFPIGEPNIRGVDYGYNEDLKQKKLMEDYQKELKRIRFIFKNLFVKSILELVNAEDEIWMLEKGLINNLYIWKKKSA